MARKISSTFSRINDQTNVNATEKRFKRPPSKSNENACSRMRCSEYSVFDITFDNKSTPLVRFLYDLYRAGEDLKLVTRKLLMLALVKTGQLYTSVNLGCSWTRKRRIYTTFILDTTLLNFGTRADNIGHSPVKFCRVNAHFWPACRKLLAGRDHLETRRAKTRDILIPAYSIHCLPMLRIRCPFPIQLTRTVERLFWANF